MKTMRLHLVAAALLLSEAVGQAQVTITEISRNEAEETPEMHAFGGETLELTLWIKGPPLATAQVTARLFQAAGELATPLGEPFPIGSVTFDGNGRQTTTAKIALPAVQMKTDIRIRFEAESGSKPLLAGTLRVQAYPTDKPAALEALAAEKERTIAVFGESETLRLFLRNNGVAFQDLGENLPVELDATMLYLGDAPSKALADWVPRSGSGKAIFLVVFTEDPSLLPGVYETTKGNLTCARVTLPMLGRLNKNPLSQTTFLNILTQILPTS